jgi:uncharacterized membrane protein HdeD (DUF308 family)
MTERIVRRSGPVASLVLGIVLIASGIALLVERARTAQWHSWTIVAILIGFVGVLAGPADERDEALLLMGAGAWLLWHAAMPALVHTTLSLVVVASGALMCGRAAAGPPEGAGQEEPHVI